MARARFSSPRGPLSCCILKIGKLGLGASGRPRCVRIPTSTGSPFVHRYFRGVLQRVRGGRSHCTRVYRRCLSVLVLCFYQGSRMSCRIISTRGDDHRYRGMGHFVRRGCRDVVSLSSLTRGYDLSGCCLSRHFTRLCKGSPVTCLGRIQLTSTHSLLLAAGRDVRRVTKYVKFSSADCFSRSFRGGFRRSPRRFHGSRHIEA